MKLDTARFVKIKDVFCVEYGGVVVADESKISNIRADLVKAHDEGICFIEIEDEFTNPEKYRNMAWGEGVPKPKFDNGFLKIRF